MSLGRAPGFSMTEVMVAAAVLGILVAIMSGFFADKFRQRNLLEVRATRDAVAERVRRAITDPDALYRSALSNSTVVNTRLGLCLNPATAVCDPSLFTPTVTVGGMPLGFDLWIANPTAGAPYPGHELLAGAGPGPGVGYDKRGRKCGEPQGPECVFHAMAYVWLSCPVDRSGNRPLPSCPGNPETVNVLYHVTSTYYPNPSNTGFRLESFPADARFAVPDKTTFALTVKVADIRLRYQQNCPPFSRSTGFDAQGQVTCKCHTKATSWWDLPSPPNPPGTPDPNRPKLCERAECPDDQPIMIGIYGPNPPPGNETGTPICAKRRTTSWTCVANPTCDCGNNAWIINVDYGECRYMAPGKKGGVGSVSCDRNNIGCMRSQLP